MTARFCAVVAIAAAVPIGVCFGQTESESPVYPTSGLARFVVDNLDVTSFPSSLGPRRTAGKKLFRDYEAVPHRITENEADLKESDDSWYFVITILKRTDSGIFVCFEDRGMFPAHYYTKSVLLLARPDAKSMLTGKESGAAFSECPNNEEPLPRLEKIAEAVKKYDAAQGSSGPQHPLNWSADDGKRVESLVKAGSRIEGAHVILYFPPSLPRADAEVLVKRLDPAVEGLWRQVGVHDWQAVPKGKITYYLHDDAFVAHASGRSAVFVPMARVKDGRAPFLHEATHELLASKRSRMPAAIGFAAPVRYPLWLTEGLADYVARVVANQLGIVEQGPFGPRTLSEADALCAERARTPDGARMLPFVGAGAVPAVLFTTDRARFAPAFYSCSLSFTKYLAEQIGLDALINLFALTPTGLVARLDSIAGRPLPVVVTEWRTRLGLQ